jgi:hypothetical protein
VWCIVLVYGETPGRNGTPKRYDCGKYELTTLIKVLTDEKER